MIGMLMKKKMWGSHGNGSLSSNVDHFYNRWLDFYVTIYGPTTTRKRLKCQIFRKFIEEDSFNELTKEIGGIKIFNFMISSVNY